MSDCITKLPTYDEIGQLARETYRQSFGTEPELACCAPGRVNLIGEHVDYNDGFVLPMALPMVTLIAGAHRNDNEVEIITCCPGVDEPKRVKFNLMNLQAGKPKWANYVKGVINGFGNVRNGFNAVITSNVPIGAGLSSSAALEVAMLTFLEHFTRRYLQSDAKRAGICQLAEHKFVGMPCGIMDQTISVMGQKDHALLLDCQSLETFQIPFVADAKDVVVLICNSGVRHELSESEYPTRRRQCAQALQLMGLKSFRDATEANLSALQLPDQEVLLRRARHVITEIKRTQDAANALRDKNFAKMGEQMIESHASLRADFEVSCNELDVLVDTACQCDGVLGSRMTGGGFGGCTVTLLQRHVVDKVIARMREDFSARFNESAANKLEFYICTPSQGARRVCDF